VDAHLPGSPAQVPAPLQHSPSSQSPSLKNPADEPQSPSLMPTCRNRRRRFPRRCRSCRHHNRRRSGNLSFFLRFCSCYACQPYTKLDIKHGRVKNHFGGEIIGATVIVKSLIWRSKGRFAPVKKSQLF